MALSSNLRGIGFLLMGGFVFVLNDSFMKLAMADLPPYEVLVLRGFSGAIFAAMVLLATGEARQWLVSLNRFVFLRAALETGAILTYILALAHAPIGDVTAIFQITPLLVIMGMIILHREKTSGLRLLLVAAGFGGALAVAQPGTAGTSPYLMLAFIAPVFAAARDLAGRRIPQSVSALLSTLVTILFVMTASLIVGLTFEHWVLPTPKNMALTVAAGLFMMLGHFFTLLAFKLAAAQAVAPFYYSFMLFAVGLGYLLFNDVPNVLAIMGMVAIVISGLAIIALEKPEASDLL